MKKQHGRARNGLSAPGLICSSLFALPLACLSGVAHAQSASGLGEVVVTASRLPVTDSGLAQSVTIIDKAEILESNPARIEDVLSRVTGVHITRSGSGSGFSSIFMRGGEESHVLIMVDGVKMNDPTTDRGSAYDLSSIDISQVERIEVLRGPASAIHGGEALSGVINIITKGAVKPGLQGDGYIGLGQDGYARGGGSLRFGNDLVRGQVRVGRSLETAPGDSGSLRLSNFAGSLRFMPSATVDGEVFITRTERNSNAFPDQSGGPRLAISPERSTRESVDTTYGAKFSAGDARTVLVQGLASVLDRSEKSNNPAIFYAPFAQGVAVPGYFANTDFRRTTLNLSATHEFKPGSSIVVGAERQNEDGSSAGAIDYSPFYGIPFQQPSDFQLERSTNSVFAEGRWQIAKPVSIQLGVRRDSTTGGLGDTTPHLGAVWQLPNGVTKLRASYSEGFKLPSFFALSHPIVGNASLRPERSKNTELGLSQRLDAKGSSFDVNLFHIDYRDLVYLEQSGYSYQMVNRGMVRTQGVEPTIDYRFSPSLRGRLGLTLMDIDTLDGGGELRNRPEKMASASLHWKVDSASNLYGVMRYGGRTFDSYYTGDMLTLPSQTTFDVGYSRQFGKFLGRVAIDNLFDKQYEQFIGFPALGRRLRFEVRGSF
jgi:vitamin B12 transporter